MTSRTITVEAGAAERPPPPKVDPGPVSSAKSCGVSLAVDRENERSSLAWSRTGSEMWPRVSSSLL